MVVFGADGLAVLTDLPMAVLRYPQVGDFFGRQVTSKVKLDGAVGGAVAAVGEGAESAGGVSAFPEFPEVCKVEAAELAVRAAEAPV